MTAAEIRRVLTDPIGAIDALAKAELPFHVKTHAEASTDPAFGYLADMERAAILILGSGPTAIRQEFVLYTDRQTPLCQGVLDMRGMWGYRENKLTWIEL